ncbi:MAG TPA: DsbA family protein [Azospirillum sp.]|nr:DsbA family protein [Azospirillum sp.]
MLSAMVAVAGTPADAQSVDTTAALSDRVLGDPKAPVTIIEYSSLTCPHCARFHTETLPKIKQTYIDTGKAKLIFRDFPFDQWALRASMLTRCAPPERYFPLLDVLFKSQAQWSTAKDPAAALTQIGKLAGVSENTIKACWADQKLADGILNIRLEAQNRDKIESTPTFILNDGAARIEGAQPFETFAAAIDKLAK